ncbi:UPF0545 protein C22orf39 homolog [Stylophora pistillata]|uniref:Synaptic plasticity regulator PANTS n=1 Tax=Stylophora pistillata TaxID=50429 RepID=A0A2B4RP66_STYPI|nr:UPF0545 protein C22orf39 homolog [Stylophora pistillata]PFX18137.1 UPF0545 protein C22orf39-like [Stylophora pistillata]
MSDFMTTVLGEENSQKDRVAATEFKRPSCHIFFDKFRFCRSSWNQFHRYYIYGSMQDCAIYFQAFRSCMSYTFTKSPEAKAIMQEALEMDEIKFTSSSVWERREKPSEHWNHDRS